MEPIVIERTWTQGAEVTPELLRGVAFTQEALAHVFRVSGVDSEGGPLAISGSVLAKFLRADNVTINISGSTSDGVANVTLVGDCYHVPGRFSLAVYVSDGVASQAIYAAVGTVYRTASETELDSGTTVPTLAQLEGAYDAVLAAASTASDAATAAQQTASDAAADARRIASDAADVALAAAQHAVRYDETQGLTDTQKAQARANTDSNLDVGLYLDSEGYICQN